jgi:hypothetical protein
MERELQQPYLNAFITIIASLKLEKKNTFFRFSKIRQLMSGERKKSPLYNGLWFLLVLISFILSQLLLFSTLADDDENREEEEEERKRALLLGNALVKGRLLCNGQPVGGSRTHQVVLIYSKTDLVRLVNFIKNEATVI